MHCDVQSQLQLRSLANDLARCACRPFMRATLFQTTEQERLNKLMQQAAGNAHMTHLLEAEAAVEVAAHAAACRQWDR